VKDIPHYYCTSEG